MPTKTAEEPDAPRRLMPLRQREVFSRCGFTGALHALLLLDLPQDSRRRWVCDKYRRFNTEHEGARQAPSSYLQSAGARRGWGRVAPEQREALLLCAVRQCSVGMGPDMARACASARRRDRYATSDTDRACPLPSGVEGVLGRSRRKARRSALRSLPGHVVGAVARSQRPQVLICAEVMTTNRRSPLGVTGYDEGQLIGILQCG